jgi:hypothetical protein
VLNQLDYKLKLDKKEYTEIYFELRKYVRKNLKSCQNKNLCLKRIRELQQELFVEYKANFVEKRPSF